MVEKLLTIGAYGKAEDEFFGQLAQAGIDTFCDIRGRRGVRGAQYRFVNSVYLQNALARIGITYRYVPTLAPSPEIRAIQNATDVTQGIKKRDRQELGENFKQRYVKDVLAPFDSELFRDSFDPNVRVIALFCVEHLPAACHRSLVAGKLEHDWNVPVEHL